MERITSRKNPLLMKIRKLSSGSARARREAGPEELCALLERSGLPLYATALRADTVSLEQAGLGRCAVIIGSEGRGVSQSLLDRSGQTIRIPMRSRCESLNAAAAASVVLWEMVRQGGLEE